MRSGRALQPPRRSHGSASCFAARPAWLRHLACGLALLALPPPWPGPPGEAPAWAPWVLGAWFVGLGGFSLRTARAFHRLQRLAARADKVEGRWAVRSHRLRRRAGVRRFVRLASTTRIDVPMVVGWSRPVVLVPPCLLTGLPPGRA